MNLYIIDADLMYNKNKKKYIKKNRITKQSCMLYNRVHTPSRVKVRSARDLQIQTKQLVSYEQKQDTIQLQNVSRNKIKTKK